MGIRARAAKAAASKAFWKRIAQSNPRCRRADAAAHLTPAPRQPLGASYGINSSQNGSRLYKLATQGLANMEMRAAGNCSRKACNAGTDITASPTQFVARTKILRNCILVIRNGNLRIPVCWLHTSGQPEHGASYRCLF